MARTAPIARALHDLGLAAWFGGSLMGAVGLEGRERDAAGDRQASAAWARWKPVARVAIAAHLLGGAVLTFANRRRIRQQKGVFALSATKAALTCAALAANAYAEALGRKVDEAGPAPDGEPVTASAGAAVASPERAAAERKRRAMRWLVPALTGGIAVTSALLGERQRPQRALRDVVRALPEHLPSLGSLAALPAVSELPEHLRRLPEHLPEQLPEQLRHLPEHLPEQLRHLPEHLPEQLRRLPERLPALSDLPRLPDIHLPDVRLPDVRLPEVRLADLPSLPKPSRLPFRTR